MERREFEVVYWPNYDVNWYIWYEDGQISGLNFWHGEFDLKNGCEGPDEMLLNIYYNLAADPKYTTKERLLEKTYITKLLTFNNRREAKN